MMDKTITVKKVPMIMGAVFLVLGQVLGGWFMNESAPLILERALDTAFWLGAYGMLLWNIWSE
jgi:uncharacterized membrane protein